MENIKQLSLSHLSLIILDPNTLETKKMPAMSELYERFNKEINYVDKFLYYENNVLLNRGYDINSYLIGDNPTIQQLMEIYFTYVKDNENIHDKILFSESHFCNNSSNISMFKKILRYEHRNIDMRMYYKKIAEDEKEFHSLENIKNNKIELDQLKKVKEIVMLQEEKNKNDIWYKNTGTQFLYDIYNNQLYGKNVSEIFGSKFINYVLYHRILMGDFNRLINQKTKILESVINGTSVNYDSPLIKKHIR